MAEDQAGVGSLLEEHFGEEKVFVREAMHYEKLDDRRVECVLCPRECQVADRERGTCGVRENRDGTYYTLVHGRLVSTNNDPIEKKPMFHYLPGTKAMSVATAGCNIECKFCQNWNISQFRPEQVRAAYVTPQDLVRLAKRVGSSCVAHTYSEPVIFYEYVYDVGKEAVKNGIGNIIVSNGYINEKPLMELLPYLTGVKIDLKAFSEKFYVESCDGHLQPVLDTLVRLSKAGVWFEIVVLVIPTLNDGKDEITEMCKWIHGELGPDVPTHFSAFHPEYKIRNLPRTPLSTLEMAWDVGKAAGLHYVYLGNIRGHTAESTYCPSCGTLLIQRYGYQILENTLRDGHCPKCRTKIPGVWAGEGDGG